MVKLKEKGQAEKKKQKHASRELCLQKKNVNSEPPLKEDFWNEAVQKLQDMEFADIDQALVAVVDSVIEKVGGIDASNPELRQFLFDLLDTDPGIKEELKQVLQIRK